MFLFVNTDGYARSQLGNLLLYLKVLNMSDVRYKFVRKVGSIEVHLPC